MEMVNYKRSAQLINPYVVKCVLLGNPSIGKSTLLNVLTTGRFDNQYEATVGIDFGTKLITLPDYNNQQIKLQIWDTAGQEKFHGIIKSYLRDVYIAFLVFDLTDRNSWDGMVKWKKELENYIKYDQIPLIVLVGTKSDLKDQKVTLSEIKFRSEEWGCDYHIVSAKEFNAQTKISRIFSVTAEKFHHLIVYKHINGYEIPNGIYNKSDTSKVDISSKTDNNKSCCFQ